MLKRSGMVERTDGTTAFSLEMQRHESARIRDIYFHEATNAAEDLKWTVDRKSVLQAKFPIGCYLVSEDISDGFNSIKSSLMEAGLWPIIPLASGQVLGITAPGANNYMEVVYDLYDGDEVKASEPNGSDADVYRMLQVVSNSGVRTTAGDLALDQSDLDAEFVDFPGGAVVPAKHQVELLALFGVGVTISGGGTVGQSTSYIKMLGEREDLLDKDLGGFTLIGNIADTSNALVYDTVVGRLTAGVANQPSKIITFDDPIIFPAGFELNVAATIVNQGAGADFAAGGVKLGMVMDVRRVG